MHTLKVQLGLTLSILLFISMFLFGFVMLMLWQRNGIQQEARISERMLYMVSATLPQSIGKSSPIFPKELAQYFKESGILCLQWQKPGDTSDQFQGSCPDGLPLKALLRKSALSHKTETLYSGMSWNGFFISKQYLLIAIPLLGSPETPRAVGLIRSLDEVSSSIRRAQKIFFAYLIVNVLIFTTIGFTRLVHLVIKPIERLSRLADSRTDLNDTSFLSSEGLGEFTQLSLSLNRLVTRIDGDKQELRHNVESLKKANDELQKNRDEMIRAEKLASVGRLSAGLAHEIGNPLGIIQGYIDLLAEEDLEDRDREIFSKRATQELARINALIRNLLDISRSPVAASIDTIDLHHLLSDLIKTVRVRKTDQLIEYTTDFRAEKSRVFIDSEGLRQVFLNCIMNSIDAIEELTERTSGTISLSTKNGTSEDALECIIVTLQDDGCGIDPRHMDAIFDPFFTTKEVGKGTGLGLAVAHNMIKKSGGSIIISSDEQPGSTLVISLPLSTPQKL